MAIRICLDAGHYAKYNRSPVVREYYESEMNWKLHLMLKEELEKYGFEVITTREIQKNDLSLWARGQKAKGCDLFLSLHSNACNSESVDRVVVIVNLEDNKTDIDEKSKVIGEKLGKVIKETMGVSTYRVITKKSEDDRDKNGIMDDEYYGVLNGSKQAKVPGMILEHSFHTNTYATKWLLDDNNLRKLAINEAKVLSEHYGQVIKANINKTCTNMSEKEIWDALLKEIGNEYGVAGLMGNLYAECGLNPKNLQNNGNKTLNLNDDEFTSKLDNGTYTKETFIKDGYGYGLAQWTYWSRKQNFYEYMISKNVSFGCCKTQIEFLLKEIKGYKNVYTTLQNATSVRQASDVVLLEYERPADQSESVQIKRSNYGQTYYDKYKKVIVEQPEQPKEEVKKYYRVRKSWEDAKSQIGAYEILQNAINACKDGYKVFDWNGNVVYPIPKVEPPKQESTNTSKPTNEYTIGMYKVTCDDLNIRKGPGTNYDIVGSIKDNGTYTIVEVQNGHWGRLKSGAGWISIHKNYCKKVKDIENTNTPAATPTPQPTREIKVGDKCKIKKGAKTYDNTKTFKSFVYTNTYNIISVKGDRVVFGIGTAVTGAIHKDNIILL